VTDGVTDRVAEGGPTRYPVLLDVTGRRVVVVGGGAVGARRAAGLAEAGADVLLVAPVLGPAARALVAAGKVRVARRAFRAADLDDAWFVQAATGHADVDDEVLRAADERRIWAVRAADAGTSPAWTVTAVRHEGLIVAVSGGGDPWRASALRDAIAAGLADGTLPSAPGRGRPDAGVAERPEHPVAETPKPLPAHRSEPGRADQPIR
jgi:uroporphyrin-III C-methyltransferase/precorrin-2 dehydrogenase/sirohydrochlorin ferrochelatase